MNDLCNDNRFELIERYKKKLIEATNIETAPDEMAVIDNILFRFWQMGWLESTDTISRQAAIEELRTCYDTETITYTNGNEYINYEQAVELIEQLPSAQPENMCVNLDIQKIATHKSDFSDLDELPSAQPERKKGRWRRRLVDSGFNADWHCSECDWKTSLEEHGYNFCPNCGADMRKGKEE